MGVFPGLMSYQRASRGYQIISDINLSGVLQQVPFVAPTPRRRCFWRHGYFLAVQLLDVVGLGWNHENNTSNYSIAQLPTQVDDS